MVASPPRKCGFSAINAGGRLRLTRLNGAQALGINSASCRGGGALRRPRQQPAQDDEEEDASGCHLDADRCIHRECVRTDRREVIVRKAKQPERRKKGEQHEPGEDMSAARESVADDSHERGRAPGEVDPRDRDERVPNLLSTDLSNAVGSCMTRTKSSTNTSEHTPHPICPIDQSSRFIRIRT